MATDAVLAPSAPFVRPYALWDDVAIRALFRSASPSGPSAGLPVRALHTHEELGVGWYLTFGRRHTGVIDDSGRVTGYATLCCRAPAWDRWTASGLRRWTGRALREAALGRLSAPERTLLVLHALDWLHARRAVAAPYRARAQIVTVEAAGGAGLDELIRHVASRVAAADLPGWCTETDIDDERSLSALEAAHGRVVAVTANRVRSWLAGRPVRLATVAVPAVGTR